MVLKLPLTRAASTKGLHRYSGFWTGGGGATKEEPGGTESIGEGAAEEGVGDRFWPRWARVIVRLHGDERRIGQRRGKTYPKFPRKDIVGTEFNQTG